MESGDDVCCKLGKVNLSNTKPHEIAIGIIFGILKLDCLYAKARSLKDAFAEKDSICAPLVALAAGAASPFIMEAGSASMSGMSDSKRNPDSSLQCLDLLGLRGLGFVGFKEATIARAARTYKAGLRDPMRSTLEAGLDLHTAATSCRKGLG